MVHTSVNISITHPYTICLHVVTVFRSAKQFLGALGVILDWERWYVLGMA